MAVLIPWLQLVRPFTLLPPLVGMLSGAAAAFGAGRAVVSGGKLWALVLAGSLMAAALNAASNVLNQLHDLEIDRINKPERPLPRGVVSRRGAGFLAAGLYAASLVLAWMIQPAGRPEVAAIVALTALLTWAYSSPPLRLRRSWWAGPLVIAVPRGGLLKVAGWGTLAPVLGDGEPWVLGGVFFLFILGCAPTKDFEDMDGDRVGGVMSLPLRFGARRAALMMAPFYVLPWAVLMLLPYVEPAGRPLSSLQPAGAVVLGGLLLLHGTATAGFLVRAAGGRGLGRGAWRNLYLLMLEAQVGLAAAYLIAAG